MTTLHLGIDLGATNIKWAVVRRDDGWDTVDRGQVPTHAAQGANAVVARMAGLARDAAASGPISTVGVGVPGLYDARTGSGMSSTVSSVVSTVRISAPTMVPE
jgi:predicted NBD/HSP70 family sugar kinase